MIICKSSEWKTQETLKKGLTGQEVRNDSMSTLISLWCSLLMTKCWCQVCVVVWLPQDITSISIWAWTIINQGADVGFFQCQGFQKDESEKIGWRKARQQHPKVMCLVKKPWSHVKVTPMQKHIGRFELWCITSLLIDLCDRMAS